MAIAVDGELILDFLTEAQSILYVPYSLYLDGLALNVLFDQDQFEPISFRITNNMDGVIQNRVYLESALRLLTYYDPYLLSEMDDTNLVELYHDQSFKLKSQALDLAISETMPSTTISFRALNSMDELTLETMMTPDSKHILHMSSTTIDLEFDGPMRLYDRYLLVEFDPDYLLDMYGISFIEGGL